MLPGFTGDTGQATAAQLSTPTGVARRRCRQRLHRRQLQPPRAQGGSHGRDYDVRRHRCRRLLRRHRAGDRGQLSLPRGVSVDGAGNVYIADTGNHRVRRVDPTGVITTVAGTGAPGFTGDTGQANLAQVNLTTFAGVASDAAGNDDIADRNNNRVRKVATNPPTASFTANPTSGPAPLTVQFDASASTDPGGARSLPTPGTFGDDAAGSRSDRRAASLRRGRLVHGDADGHRQQAARRHR